MHWAGRAAGRVRRVEPDLVASSRLAVKFQAELFQPFDDVPVAEPRQRTHQVATMSG